MSLSKALPGMDAPISYGIIGTGRAITNTSNRSIKCSTRRLHVSNIPFAMTDDDLRQLFEPYGEIKDAQVISNKRGSKGFGFVTFVNLEDAARAKKDMDGLLINNRHIEVNDALPKTKLTIVPTSNMIKDPKMREILMKINQRHNIALAPTSEPIRQAHAGRCAQKPLDPFGAVGDFKPFKLFSSDFFLK